MSRSFLFDPTRSFLHDPQHEDRTSGVRKAAWLTYAKAIDAALDRYSADVQKARSEYLKNRRGYLSGTILRPTLKQLLYVWPTDAQLTEFDDREAGQLAEFEKMVFVASCVYAREERDARLAYWKAVEAAEGVAE